MDSWSYFSEVITMVGNHMCGRKLNTDADSYLWNTWWRTTRSHFEKEGEKFNALRDAWKCVKFFEHEVSISNFRKE